MNYRPVSPEEAKIMDVAERMVFVGEAIRESTGSKHSQPFSIYPIASYLGWPLEYVQETVDYLVENRVLKVAYMRTEDDAMYQYCHLKSGDKWVKNYPDIT